MDRSPLSDGSELSMLPVTESVQGEISVPPIDAAEARLATLRDLLEQLPIAISVCSLASGGRVLFSNAQFLDCFGYTPEEIGTVEAWARLAYPDPAYRAAAVAWWEAGVAKAAVSQGWVTSRELRVTRKDGVERDVSISAKVQDDILIASFVDITERKQANQQIQALNASLEQRVAELSAVNAALQESEDRFRRLFEETRQPLSLIEHGRFIAANQATLTMLRMERMDQLIGRSPGDVSPDYQPDGRRSAEKAAEMIRIAFEQGSNEFEWEHVRADGEHFPAVILLTAISDNNRHLMHVVWNDISEQRKATAQIEYLAFHDALTGLPNRVLGQERLMHEVAAAARHRLGLAVLYLDMDKFKYVNDTHGHAVGDRLLKEIAQRLIWHLRPEDILCRLSSDEFMMVLPELDPRHLVARVAATCERLLASLAEPFDLDGLQLFSSFSIGVASYPQDGRDGETLMRHADTALYEAKRAGPHGYRFFEPSMNAALVHFVRTRDALRMALERRELVLHYQPQIDLRTGRLVGAEALLRWRRHGRELTMPGTFIEAAEESGLIVAIGHWVLREACRQGAAWQAAGYRPLVIAVNLSAVQFRQGSLGQDVLAALDESGLDPAALELELTESILLHDPEAVRETVAAWKERGIQLSIDDFGTGYSSLAYLKRFKVDKLKIDRSFINGLQYDEEDRAIVQAIIQIAHSLKLRTIAEGVEDRAQARRLAAMGCDQVQGYLYSQPLAPEQLERWLVHASTQPHQPQPSPPPV